MRIDTSYCTVWFHFLGHSQSVPLDLLQVALVGSRRLGGWVLDGVVRLGGGWACRARLFWGWIADETRQLIYEYKTVLRDENQSVFKLDSSHTVLIWYLSRMCWSVDCWISKVVCFGSGRVWRPLFPGLLSDISPCLVLRPCFSFLGCWERNLQQVHSPTSFM